MRASEQGRLARVTAMMETIYSTATDLFTRGGWVMWPLCVMSLVAVTLILERCWFWFGLNGAGNVARLAAMMQRLRQGDTAGAEALARNDSSVYGRIVLQLLREPATDAAGLAAVESQRHRLERFMPTLSTIITAAPMLGILGTVTGIIRSLNLLSQQVSTTDPRLVAHGIAEALITTAAGLVVALVVLFPYNAFRAQLDRTMGRIEALIAAVQGMERGIEGLKD